ncbi:MAG: hypothetical protein P8R42_23815 [Candidatus Binatia bacterium]|nr:hypothetical protein [Candidatus Binatia bacterium]
MRAGLRQSWLAGVRAVFCSTEQVAIDGAEIPGATLGLRPTRRADLGVGVGYYTAGLAEADGRDRGSP